MSRIAFIGWGLIGICLNYHMSQERTWGQQGPPDSATMGAEIRDDLSAGRLSELEVKLDQWTRTAPDWQLILAGRQRLGLRFLRDGAKEKATRQATEMLAYGRAMLERQKNLVGACMAVIQADPLLRGLEDVATADAWIASMLGYIDAEKSNPLPADLTLARSLLRRLQANQLRSQGKVSEGERLLTTDLEDVRRFQQQEPNDPERAAQVILGWVALALGVELDQQRTIYEEIQRFGIEQLRVRPNIPVLFAYSSATTNFIGGVNSSDPARAKGLLDKARQEMQSIEINATTPDFQTAFKETLRGLENLSNSVEQALLLQGLLNSKAPEFQAARWVNGRPSTLAELRGNVVVLSFWAVWHQPSLQSLPQLESLAQRFPGKVQVIGVTMPYGLRWDAETQKIVKPEVAPSIEQELDLLAEVSRQFKLTYPTMLIDQSNTLPSQLGVTNIPHIVLIDSMGTIQLVLVGSATNNTEQILQAVEKLAGKSAP